MLGSGNIKLFTDSQVSTTLTPLGGNGAGDSYIAFGSTYEIGDDSYTVGSNGGRGSGALGGIGGTGGTSVETILIGANGSNGLGYGGGIGLVGRPGYLIRNNEKNYFYGGFGGGGGGGGFDLEGYANIPDTGYGS